MDIDQIELMMMMSELSSDIVPATTGAPSLTGLQEPSPSSSSRGEMREVIFRIAAMQPIRIDPEAVRAPRRRNVRISNDPQSVAARRRRERISERIRILQRIVPGGTKMDTASMLDEAVHYVKFLKTQVQTLSSNGSGGDCGIGFPVAMYSGSYNMIMNTDVTRAQNVEQYRDV